MKRLEAWLEDRHAGTFIDSDGHVEFVYDEDLSTPISLSLPRESPLPKRAAGNFLENLLPDKARARRWMAEAYGVDSLDTIDLLNVAGGDIAGGLVLLPEHQEPAPEVPELNPALERDIAARIRTIKDNSDAWTVPGAVERFSLAGTQGKFALAKVEGDWYWSNATVPSTHIVKPGRTDLPGLENIEAATLRLAERIGVPAPPAEILTASGQTAYLVERFDRAHSDRSPLARRVHTEDLAQALGLAPGAKYDPTAAQIIDLLKAYETAAPALQESFLRQLVFNTLIGNADAHAKNYSLVLRPAGIEFAPLYDAVPVLLYPKYDQRLAMRIAGARYSQAVTAEHWQKFSRSTGLDTDWTMQIVTDVAEGLRQQSATGWDTVPAPQADRLRRHIDRTANASLTG